ncbi:hypothetical protein EVAR_84507_1 [Eumeta japonica]|uniref:Uncharacterized protein n=1 Tax=Eumeta variegata TaxID=151549 RepID=A0A4C1UI09_EUMVA|nr:hypothetical protein EVAR_84507_1 [Eumeta japonica]
MSFRLTQVLSGHGCVNKYIYRITKKESLTWCHHCDRLPKDTAKHTLETCSAYAAQREALKTVVGNNLSQPTIVEKMISDAQSRDEGLLSTERSKAAGVAAEDASVAEALAQDYARTPWG